MDTDEAGRGLDDQSVDAVDAVVPPGEAEAEPTGDENEAPAGEWQSAAEADVDIQYARAALRYRKAKAEYQESRRILVSVVQVIGRDKDHLLSQTFRTPRPSYEIPLPMSFSEIRSYTGWTTGQVNDWLKYRVKTKQIITKGPRGRYTYHFNPRKKRNDDIPAEEEFVRTDRELLDGLADNGSDTELALPDERTLGTPAGDDGSFGAGTAGFGDLDPLDSGEAVPGS